MWFGAMYEYAGIGKPAVSIEILDCERKKEEEKISKLVYLWFKFC